MLHQRFHCLWSQQCKWTHFTLSSCASDSFSITRNLFFLRAITPVGLIPGEYPCHQNKEKKNMSLPRKGSFALFLSFASLCCWVEIWSWKVDGGSSGRFVSAFSLLVLVWPFGMSYQFCLLRGPFFVFFFLWLVAIGMHWNNTHTKKKSDIHNVKKNGIRLMNPNFFFFFFR